MGLSGKKDRRKLALDPNNTKWSRNETTFGQKILRSHGWEPGQYLGARDASHAALHSAASSAPIKVALKDDTLGLGAKQRQKQNDECTGLDGFKDLLGRLNGKSDEVIAKEQAIRSEIKTSLWVERRYGPMRFIKGGFLVGDQITELLNKSAESQAPAKTPSIDDVASGNNGTAKKAKREKKEKTSKKRKAADSDDLENDDTGREDRKKKKKRSKGDSSLEDHLGGSETASEPKRIKDKKHKKSKKEKSLLAEEGSEASLQPKSKKDKKRRLGAEETSGADDVSETVPAEESERRRKKKEKKRKLKEDSGAPVVALVPAVESGASTPTGTGTSTPVSRNLVRSRYLASKRMAMTDIQALNQIFMVKPV